MNSQYNGGSNLAQEAMPSLFKWNNGMME